MRPSDPRLATTVERYAADGSRWDDLCGRNTLTGALLETCVEDGDFSTAPVRWEALRNPCAEAIRVACPALFVVGVLLFWDPYELCLEQ
jgi:hypothetical protein